MHCKETLSNLPKILTISKIILLATPYTYHAEYNVFPVKVFIDDIATLLSIEIASLIRVFFLCKY